MDNLQIGIAGAAGRMGQTLVRQVVAASGCDLVAASESPGSAAYGADPAVLAGIARINVKIGDDPKALVTASTVVIDFTSPETSVLHAGLAAESGTALVIGTTGLTPEQEAVLSEASSKTAIVYAANMSVGVNVLLAVTEQVAGILGDDFDIEIFEMHHRHKVDAPSGTALAFGKAAAKGRGVDLDQVSARGRDGVTGARNSGDIGFAVQRGGSVVGEHSVLFASDQERVTISHKADDRSLFASGAVRAAMWVANKPPGLYGMKDVLGL